MCRCFQRRHLLRKSCSKCIQEYNPTQYNVMQTHFLDWVHCNLLSICQQINGTMQNIVSCRRNPFPLTIYSHWNKAQQGMMQSVYVKAQKQAALHNCKIAYSSSYFDSHLWRPAGVWWFYTVKLKIRMLPWYFHLFQFISTSRHLLLIS